ncbi:MAG: hypothetical protein H0W90_05490 [Actinobacteria bacterium]|nr:hypothetical protein [Actinomycetota bacterium]
MTSKNTISRFVGLVFLVAALSSGTANAAGSTPQGLKADGLRLQGIAQRYQEMSGYTQQGLKADGLRLQAMAQAYAKRSNRPAASFYTQQALDAMGQRWQALAQAYRQPGAATSSSTGFDWGAASIGVAGGIVVALCTALLVFGVRRVRQEKVAV